MAPARRADCAAAFAEPLAAAPVSPAPYPRGVIGKARQMPTRKHPRPGYAAPLPNDDLTFNPGIKSSRGTAGADPDDLEGENTWEGDVANQTNPFGGIWPDDWGRTNR
jgi:hypothetical protein